MRLKTLGVLTASAFLSCAVSLEASLVPGERPCSFPKKPFISKVAHAFPIFASPAQTENPGSCAKEVQDFIAKDPLYHRRWQEAAGNRRAQERLLKEVDVLFYQTGKQLRKTILSAQKFGHLSRNGLAAQRSLPLTPWLIGHEAQVVKKNLKALNLSVKKAGADAKLSWFDPQWKRILDQSLNQARRQYALFVQNERNQKKIRQKKLALARQRLSDIGAGGKSFDDPALNSTLDSSGASAPHPAGSGEAGAIMAVFLGQKVLDRKGQAPQR